VAGEGGVEVGRVEVGEPVPQCEVRRGGLLRLQRDHATHRVSDAERLAPQQHLPTEHGSVESPRGDPHVGRVSSTGNVVT
jgi:hypothetical protein